MGMLARLGVVLGLDTAEFQKGLSGAKKSLDQFAQQIPTVAGVAVAAFTAMTYKALQYADAIADTAKANDVAIESVLALSKGLQQNGGEAENAGKLLSSFTSKIDEAAQGGLDAQKTFARLGVSLQDLGSMGIQQMFDKVVASIAAMEDPISRNALAINVFGRAAKGVDFVGLAADSKEARAEFAEYAIAVQKAADLNDKLAASSEKTLLKFTNAIVPALSVVFDELNKSGGFLDKISGGFKFFLENTIFGFRVLFDAVKNTVIMFDQLGKYLGDIFTLNFTSAGKRFDEYMARSRAVNEETKQFGMKLFDMNPEEKKKPKTPVGRLTKLAVNPEEERAKKEADRLRIALEMAKQISGEYERQSQFELEQVERRGKLLGMTAKEREVEEAVLAVRDRASKQLADIEDKRADAIIKHETELAKELENQKRLVEGRTDFFVEQTRRAVQAQQEQQNSFLFGWEMAYKQFSEDSENYAKLGQQYFDTMANGMTNAITTFVKTGKFSFSEFTRSILQDLIAIQLRMQAMQLFKIGMSAFGVNFPGVSARAGGGMVSGNIPYMVGENGPELFVPQGGGSIVPTNRLESAMGGGAPSVVYNGPYIENMSAIDTQSAAQFLARNKMSVWSANQSASRSVPSSR